MSPTIVLCMLLCVFTGCEYFGWETVEPQGTYKPANGDLDGDGVPNAKDLDADGDGIPNGLENVLGVDPEGDHDKDGIPNMLDPTDRGDGTAQVCAPSADPKVCAAVAPTFDIDQDGVPNHHEADADGDSVPDNVEAGIGAVCPDAQVGRNGFCDAWETSADSGESMWPPADFDRDGIPEFLDPAVQQSQKLPEGRMPPGSGTKAQEAAWVVLGVKPFFTSAPPLWPPDFVFEDVTEVAGLRVAQSGEPLLDAEQAKVAGVAVEDVDGDGDLDIYLTRGEQRRFGGVHAGNEPPAFHNLLMRNDGSGSFQAEEHRANIQQPAAALFFDKEGRGRFDLVVTALEPIKTRFFSWRTEGGFVEAPIPVIDRSYAASAADIDGDGRPDLFLTHGEVKNERRPAFLLRNLQGGWKDATADFRVPFIDKTVTGLWGDLDHDSWPDLLITANNGGSTVLLNRNEQWQSSLSALSDENATGQVLGDLDNDGDLDWFVSGVGVAAREDLPSKYVGTDVGISGNRLMRNDGGGVLTDITDAAHVRVGGWGWGACIADLNLDGWQDIVQANGWQGGVFERSATSVWLNAGAQGFFPAAGLLGITRAEQGRSIVCADFDGDGDIDILHVNNGAPPRLWRNNASSTGRQWLEVQLDGLAPNKMAIGAKIIVRSASTTQLREVTAGSSYLSQAPRRQHFGLAKDTAAEITVIWPNQMRTVVSVAAGQLVKLGQAAERAPPYRAPPFAER